MTIDSSLIQEYQKFIHKYQDLLNKVLGGLEKTESLNDEQREQQVQHVITQIEFAQEELKPYYKQLLEQSHYQQKFSRKVFDQPKMVKHSLIEDPAQHDILIKLTAAGTIPARVPICISGESGSGKSLLALQLVRDSSVQAAYPDGIFWLTLGDDPDLLLHYQRLSQMLGKPTEFVDEEIAHEYLQSVFAARRCLLILDGVEEVPILNAFQDLGEHCRLVITTQVHELHEFMSFKEPKTLHYSLRVWQTSQSSGFFMPLAGGAERSDGALVVKILAHCHHNPLALYLLANAMGKPVDWTQLSQRLKDTEDWDFPKGHAPYLMQSLHLALESLGDQSECYLALAVFQDYRHIPDSAIKMLWHYMFQLNEDASEQLLRTLTQLGFLKRHDGAIAYVSLHTFQHAYIEDFSDMDKLHEHLLSAYTRLCPNTWLNGPDDGYFYQNLCVHLHGAGRVPTLKALLFDFDWLNKKLQRTSLYQLILDLHLSEDPEIASLENGLLMSAQALIDKQQPLALVLLNNLWQLASKEEVRQIQALLNQARETVPAWEPEFPENDLLDSLDSL